MDLVFTQLSRPSKMRLFQISLWKSYFGPLSEHYVLSDWDADRKWRINGKLLL